MTRPVTRLVSRLVIPRRAGLGLAGLALVGAGGTLAGCGVSTEAIHPGSAAVVGDTEVDARAVDDAVPGACAYIVPDGQAIPMSIIRQRVLYAYVAKAAIEDLADDKGLSFADGTDVDLDGADEGLTDDQVAATQAYLRAQQYVSNGLLALASTLPQDTATDGPGDPNQAILALQNRAFAAYVTPWLASHTVDLSPSFGLAVDADGSILPAADGLSVPASDLALGSSIDYQAADSDIQAKLDALVARLPADQVCGTPAPAEPAAPAVPQSQVTANPRPTS